MSFTTSSLSKHAATSVCRKSSAAAVERAFSSLDVKPTDAWDIRYFELERQRLIALIHEWLNFERGREDFGKVAHQQKVEFQLAGLDLRGRIDRIDRLQDGSLVIIDYKPAASPSMPDIGTHLAPCIRNFHCMRRLCCELPARVSPVSRLPLSIVATAA